MCFDPSTTTLCVAVPFHVPGSSDAAAYIDKHCDDLLHVPEYLSGRHAYRLVAPLSQGTVSSQFPIRAIGLVLEFSVDLNRESHFQATKVERHPAERMVFAELVSARLLFQHGPQQALSGRHVLS